MDCRLREFQDGSPVCLKHSFVTHHPVILAENLRELKTQRISSATSSQNSVSQTMHRNYDRETSIDTFQTMGYLLGYARVSTGNQDAQLQLGALTKAGCYRIFTDTASGALKSRPELD